jgi:hypothetical protein
MSGSMQHVIYVISSLPIGASGSHLVALLRIMKLYTFYILIVYIVSAGMNDNEEAFRRATILFITCLHVYLAYGGRS